MSKSYAPASKDYDLDFTAHLLGGDVRGGLAPSQKAAVIANRMNDHIAVACAHGRIEAMLEALPVQS